jgi:hypothetical protein
MWGDLSKKGKNSPIQEKVSFSFIIFFAVIKLTFGSQNL